MVCKDDVFAWFRHLSGSGRIEVVHGLLNMCMPLELRFAGTCVEFLARKDFRSLKEHELKANSALETSKLRVVDWVQDPIARHKMTVCLALLGSANTAASKFVFDALTLNETQQSLADKLGAGDANARSEVLLMFILALCHPAFTFAQKEEIAVRLKVVQSIADRLDGKIQDQHQGGGRKCEAEEANGGGGGGSGDFGGGSEGPSGGPGYVGASGGNTYSNVNGSSHGGTNLMSASGLKVVTMCLEDTVREGVSGNVPLEPADTTAPGLVAALAGPNRVPSTCPKIAPLPSQQTAQTGKSHIKNLELHKKMPKQKKDKRVEFKIQVTWSGGEVTDVIKSQQELCTFHQQLVHSFAEDGASHRQERSIPYFPGPRLSRGEAPAEEGMSRMVVDYLRQLMTKVPQNMLDSELVTSFFKGQQSPAKVPNGPSAVIGNPSSSQSFSSLNVAAGEVSATDTLDDRVAKDGVGGEARVKTLTVYNSHLPGDSPTTRSANDCGRWKASGSAVAPVAGASSPMNFVHRNRPSPTSSPSPAQPAPGSYSVQEILPDRFGKESDRKDLEPSFRSLSIEESLNRDDLEKMNPKPAQMTRMLEKVKSSCPNGLVTHSDERVLSPHLHGNRRFPSAEWSQPSSDGIVYACQPQVYMPNTSMDFLVQYSTQQRPGYGGQVLSDSSEYSSPAASPALDRPGSRSDSDDNVETTEPEDARGLRNQTVHPAHNVSNMQQHPPRHLQQQQQHGYQKVKTYPAVAMLENANVALVHPQQLRGKGPIRGRSNSNSSVAAQDTGRKAANRPQTLGPLPRSQGPRAEPVSVEMGAMYTGPATLTYPAVSYVSTQQGQVRSPAATPPPLPQAVTSAALCTNCTCSCTTTTPHLSFSPSFIPFHMGGAASVTTMFTGYAPALHGPSQQQPTHVPPPPANGYLHTHTGMHNFAYPPPQGMPPGMAPDLMYSQAQFQPPGVMQQQMGLAGSPSNGAGAGAPQVPGFLTGPTPNVGFHGPVGAYPQVNAHTQRAFGEHYSVKKPSCYNCGLSGHFGGECLEVTMEEVTNKGQYRLNLHQDPNELGEEN